MVQSQACAAGADTLANEIYELVVSDRAVECTTREYRGNLTKPNGNAVAALTKYTLYHKFKASYSP